MVLRYFFIYFCLNHFYFMRLTLLFLSLVLVIACKKQTPEVVQSFNNNDIEIYKYSELEPLLNYKDNKTYVINFWATWCAPCLKELPYFEELHDKYGNQNLRVILVSLDFPDKFESQLKPFVKKKNLLPQVILLDDPNENEWIPKVDESWSGALPATLIYNKNKRAFYEQSFTKESLFNEVNKFTKL